MVHRMSVLSGMFIEKTRLAATLIAEIASTPIKEVEDASFQFRTLLLQTASACRIIGEILRSEQPSSRPPIEAQGFSSHNLKTWPSGFRAIWEDRKRYEIRQNDRDYKVGDILYLLEYDPDTCLYSGRSISAQVTYLTRGGDWDLPANMCVMSIHIIERRENPNHISTLPPPSIVG